MKILVTGAQGYVGRALCRYLVSEGYDVRGTVRDLSTSHVSGEDLISLCATGSIECCRNWSDILEGVDTVIHLAAKVHQMEEDNLSVERFQVVNVDATRRLALAAVESGVRRFIFLSSIKVNGDGGDAAYTEADTPQPGDPYASSKLAAEKCLTGIAVNRDLEVVTLRPPLIYGPDVEANYYRLIRLVAKRIPLPVGKVKNHRSMVYIGNLVSAIEVCIRHPAAVGETFLISDGEDISTPELIRRIADGLCLRPRLWSVPLTLLRFAARLAGKDKEIDRLSSSLQVDSSRIRKALGWVPPFSLNEGLRCTLEWYRGKQKP